MIGVAALITAFAALISALAWPTALLAVLILFRHQLGIAFRDVPGMIGRMHKVKLGAFEAELSAKAADLIDEAVAEPGSISARQIQSAARMQVVAKTLPDEALRDQLQQLCIEYETVRKVLPSGNDRTRAMTNVLVRMRTLAPSVAKFVGELKASSAAGSRLAAVAIMQVNPGLADPDWLLERFRGDTPFIFFQSATVLRTLSNLEAGMNERYREIARQAAAIVRSFPGSPDDNTLAILDAVADGKPG